MENKKTILFLLPTYKYISSRSFVCFASFLFNIKKYYNAKFKYCEGLYITIARSILAESYVKLDEEKKREIDLTVWMDDDIVFTMKQLTQLIEKFDGTGLDMLSALYFSRSTKEPIAYNLDPDEVIMPLKNIRNTGIVKCDAAGFGFLAMKPEVLDKMYEANGKWMFKTPILPHKSHKDGVQIGEDIHFFMKAKELHLKLGVDTDIVIGHESCVIE